MNWASEFIGFYRRFSGDEGTISAESLSTANAGEVLGRRSRANSVRSGRSSKGARSPHGRSSTYRSPKSPRSRRSNKSRKGENTETLK